jgi:hypothetical protein
MLPFSRRTTTAVTVFACLFAARDAWHLTTVASQIGALHQSHATLFHLYRQIRHQDVANQAAVLASLIAQAQTAINNLNTIVQAIEPTVQNQTNQALPDLQAVVLNAVYVMTLVEGTE